MEITELQNIENQALRKVLTYIDDYCAKSNIVIPASRDKGFDTLKLVDEIKRLS